MDTLWKALLGTLLIIVAIIGLPILVGLIGLLWPVVLVIGLIIFIPIAIGIIIGKKSGEDWWMEFLKLLYL